MTSISFMPQIISPLNNRTRVNFTSNNKNGSDELIGEDCFDPSSTNIKPSDDNTEIHDYDNSEAFSLDKGDESKNPVLAKVIKELYDKLPNVITDSKLYKKIFKGKDQETIEIEDIREGYARNPDDKIISADNTEARILTKKVKLDDNTYVLLGIDRGVKKTRKDHQEMRDPEAFIKIVDKELRPNKTEKEMYYTHSGGEEDRDFPADPVPVPIHCYYDKLLLKIADRICRD